MIYVAITLVAAFVIIAVLACCKVSSECSGMEEQRQPCSSCPRWEECNGVDEMCPWR